VPRVTLDLPGMITLGLGPFGVLRAMTRLSTTVFDAAVAGYLIGGCMLIGTFVFIEGRQPEPTVPLSWPARWRTGAGQCCRPPPACPPRSMR
jgi:hypothetical protein